MCGIFGYIGPRTDAGKIVIHGLQKLEYRGYDSWGVALKPLGTQRIYLHKTVGKIGDASVSRLQLPAASVAIGHSRWATHGGVTDRNAHPHMDESKSIAVVHNGIIENFQQLKTKLKKHKFISETDTEIVPHLIEEKLHLGFEEAVRQAMKILEGRFAIVVMHKDTETIIAARRGSPLVVGEGKDEYFVASDVPAFLEYARNVYYLDDEEMAVIGQDLQIRLVGSGKRIQKKSTRIQWNVEDAEKGEHPYFMIKEIRDQRESIDRAIHQDPTTIQRATRMLSQAKGIWFVGCGTAGKVALAGQYAFSTITGKEVRMSVGSEFVIQKPFLKRGGVLVAISQSGETADTLEAVELAKKAGMKIIAMVNVEGSTLARSANLVLPLKSGPEKAVASTKATTSQLALLYLLAYSCAGKLSLGHELLIKAAQEVRALLTPTYEKKIMKLAKHLLKAESMYVLGKGSLYPMALEAAIKIQEVSYIHAEGFAAGELKHGPLALIEKKTPCIALISAYEHTRDVTNNVIEVKARGGYTVGVSPQNNAAFDMWIPIPDLGPITALGAIIPVQLLAYHLGVLKGYDPDHPRNLAKSVTVK